MLPTRVQIAKRADLNPSNQIRLNPSLYIRPLSLSLRKVSVAITSRRRRRRRLSSVHTETTFQKPRGKRPENTVPEPRKSNDDALMLWDPTDMAIADQRATSDGKILGLFKLPFRNPSTTTTSSSGNATSNSQFDGSNPRSYANSNNASSSSVSSVARSLLPTRRRLRLDPSKKLYFPCML